METALLNYFVENDELHSTCDFNPYRFQTGKLVYEVIRVIDGKPLFLEEHIKRFFNSAHLSNLVLPVDGITIVKRIKALIETNKLVNGNIEFLVHFDKEGEKKFMLWITSFLYPSPEMYEKGVATSILKAVRKKPNAKAYNRYLRRKADEIIAEKNIFEVVLINKERFITEGSRSNIFFINRNKLFTPPLSLVLPGVTRSKVFEIAEKQNIDINEINIKIDDVVKFDSCFLSGTSPKILPVKNIDTVTFNIDNPLLRNFMKWYDNEIDNYLKHFDYNKIKI